MVAPQESSLLAELTALEQELHHPGKTCSLARLNQLLHPEFHEIGRSGRAYDRVTVIKFLHHQMKSPSVVSDRFAVQRLAPQVVLLTFRSVNALTSGQREFAYRSSIWIKSNEQWQFFYHQGTPAAESW